MVHLRHLLPKTVVDKKCFSYCIEGAESKIHQSTESHINEGEGKS